VDQAVTICRIVQYRLSSDDAVSINKRRDDFEVFSRATRGAAPGQPGATGHVAHVGNRVVAGEVYPAVVVRTFGAGPDCAVNLQVLLDGADTYWATSRCAGPGEGQWFWPPRV